MGYLSAAVILVAALGVFNLLISLRLIRRLREAGGIPGRLPGRPVVLTAAVGQKIGEFTATTTAGQAISDRSLNQLTLAGFFSTSCPSCRERAPEFLRYAATFPGDVVAVVVGPVVAGPVVAGPVVAGPVVAGGDGETADLAGRLTAAGNVVVEAPDGPMVTAFEVGGYPALCVVDPHGRIIGSGTKIRDLPALVPA
jgi:hypothetical protein